MKRIIFFDGVCNLCNGFVSMMLWLDRRHKFYFAPIQGSTAKKYDLAFDTLKQQEQSIVYLNDDGRMYFRSTAVLYILSELFLFGRVFLIFIFIPEILRDYFYRLIARYRYTFFGKRELCRMPTDKETLYFLD